jgi:hypothetical protein
MALKHLYGRHNVWLSVPGLWNSADGEYEFTVAPGDGWDVRRIDTDRTVGNARTLTAAFALASRDYVSPVQS